MAQPIKVKGIVIRQVNYGDYDKMLTVLTEPLGKISVSARGVRSIKSKNRAATELLCYSEFVLTGPRGEVYNLSQAECIESFYRQLGTTAWGLRSGYIWRTLPATWRRKIWSSRSGSC